MATLRSSGKKGTWRYLIVLWISGCLLLAAIAAVGVWARMHFATVSFCMLIAIVLISLLDSFISSALFSTAGALLLNYFFTPPEYSFEISEASDIFPLAAFLVSSVAVTSLVRRGRESERRLREQARLLDLSHDAIFVRDNRDVITYWNHAAEALYGWRQSEALGKDASELLNTVFPISREELQLILLSDGHWEGELRHTNRRGDQVIVSSRWTLQRDENGEPVGTLESNNDITERLRAEDRLRRIQAQYLDEVQKLSRTGSFGWEVKTGEVFWSAQAFEIFEYDLNEAPTLAMVRNRLHPDDVAVFEQMLKDANAGQIANFDVELRLSFPGDRSKQLHIVGRVGPNGSPDSRQFIGAVMDVTTARQADERLRRAMTELSRANRASALGELGASIAHEVGQPLSAISTNAEACRMWLMRDPPYFDEVREGVEQIIAAGSRAGAIVQRIRRLIKGMPSEHTAIDINDVIEEVVGIVRRDIERQRGKFRLILAPGLPLVVGDRVQLQQVIINLVLNGIQAMSTTTANKEITVVSQRDAGGNVVVSVRDSGPGIAAENLPRLFDPFFTTRSSGMGMGLAICTSILKVHGGRLVAENNDDGQGATFRFVLPPMNDSKAA
ncbi:ATP-binding protein [Paraburkholderia sp. PGU16]|uniref:histidine kinase n=1 Tax=Paraburkholderia largidicola TaxID=3014751 RepID=A0A7I8BWJ0_9BURK|nr:ATP-binding protein [Paraburkholderia sp. PGU16]BCF92913.1 hypothetical protein PPGU16_59800 [Paraburkholderia sp. PGU16]BEU26085.1 ATP-binding protein [Paraburkholderia sp. 22B1P]